jgi:hypothetical protein
MLHVQFDAEASVATGLAPPAGAPLALRARRLGDVLDGLALRQGEPAILALRYLLAYAVGVEGLELGVWRSRGLDVERGFALVVGARLADGRWPVALAAHAVRGESLVAWLAGRGGHGRREGELVLAGGALAVEARAMLVEPWTATLASDAPYLELRARLGVGRQLGTVWQAASRRGDRFQVEIVASLPGLPPLHVIARDPPVGGDRVLPPPHLQPVPLRRGRDGYAASAAAGMAVVGPAGPGAAPLPSWDEPGPCDCGVPPDLCAMKAFRLADPAATQASLAAGADTFRQLSASIVDLHAVRTSSVRGVRAGDRVLVARRAECRSALGPEDAVLDSAGGVRPLAARGAATHEAAAVLGVLPLSSLKQVLEPRRAFAGLWDPC